MVQKYDTASNPPIASGIKLSVFGQRAWDGIDTALTHYAGSSDPSNSWGANHVGILWLDTTDAANPKLKMWCQLTASPSYGWRTLRIGKTKTFQPVELTLTPSPKAAANIAWTTLDISTQLDAQQDTGQVAADVAAVDLLLRIQPGASETVGADNAYLKVRTSSSWSTFEHRLYAAAQGRWNQTVISRLPLDAAEAFQWGLEVGGGTVDMDYEIWLCGIHEEL